MEQKKKVEKEHAMLIVNGAPVIFHKGMVTSEVYHLSNTVNVPAFNMNLPLSLANTRKLVLTMQVSTASPDYVYYGTLKEAIRVLTYLFSKMEIPTLPGEAPPKYEAFRKLVMPFTRAGDADLPWGLPAACAYVGFGISMACCLVQQFQVTATPGVNSTETWMVTLSEVDIGQFQKEYLERTTPY